MIIQPGEVSESSFFVYLPKKYLTESNEKIEIEILSNGKVLDKVKTKFMGPIL